MAKKNDARTAIEDMLYARASAISAMPDRIPTRGGNYLNGHVWREMSQRVLFELTGMTPRSEELGFDWFDAEFEARLVAYYNREMDRREALEAAT